MARNVTAIDHHPWISCNVLRNNEIEKELDGSLPCGNDMVRAERLWSVVLRSAFEGRLEV